MTGRPKSKRKGKRQPKPTAKRRATATSRYDQLAADWKRRAHDSDHGGGDWLVDKPDLPMDAVPFLMTLRRLSYVTQDRRYFDLHGELLHGGLIDAKGKWSRFGTVLAHPDTRLLCEQVEQYIAAGVPEREVLAEAVVEFNIEAASFDAAVKRLKRLLREHRKSMGQKPA